MFFGTFCIYSQYHQLEIGEKKTQTILYCTYTLFLLSRPTELNEMYRTVSTFVLTLIVTICTVPSDGVKQNVPHRFDLSAYLNCNNQLKLN